MAGSRSVMPHIQHLETFDTEAGHGGGERYVRRMAIILRVPIILKTRLKFSISVLRPADCDMTNKEIQVIGYLAPFHSTSDDLKQ
jgi:hypothetical protein